tara:strand:- start:396 stop:635 length:240 start_codon:yes stop_codon:yes gene_type:complete
MRKYKDLIKDLNQVTGLFCCDNSKDIVILVNEFDMGLLDKEVTDPKKKHSMYGIPIELGNVVFPKIININVDYELIKDK